MLRSANQRAGSEPWQPGNQRPLVGEGQRVRSDAVRSNGAPRRPVSFSRLSAVCQPTLGKLVAGARNQRYLQLWSGAA
jgi:hypothetical protein